MPEKPTFIPEQEAAFQVETTRVGGRVYENAKLGEFAETLPVQEIPLEELRDRVGPEHVYWVDRDGKDLAPYQLLSDWEAAQQHDAWADHVTSVQRANLDNPIWMTDGGHVFDGVHRLTRAVLDNVPTVKARVFRVEDLPDSALVAPE